MTPQPNQLHQRVAYTPAEFADLTGLKKEAVYRAIKAGTLKAQQFGKLYAIPAAEVERLFGSGTAA